MTKISENQLPPAFAIGSDSSEQDSSSSQASKITEIIANLSRESATDILDECFGVGCRDEQEVEALQAEILTAYQAGKISTETLLDY